MEKSIGALWIKKGNKGEYLTGNIEINGVKQNITIFKNTYKKDNQPDYRIFAQKQKETKQEDIFAPTGQDLPF